MSSQAAEGRPPGSRTTVNDERPRVSTVIAAYNSADFIRDAIESVLGQTHPVDEILVMDDGSTDATATIVADYPQVRCISQTNQGAAVSRNRGVEETTGDFIAFLDGDDVWLPDKTERQLACIAQNPDVVLVSGDMIWWDVVTGEQRVFGYAEQQRRNVKRELLFHNYVGNTSMVLLRRTVFEEVGGLDASLRWGDDWDLWIRMIEQGNAAFVPAPVIRYRWHPDNLSLTGGWARLSAFHQISRRGLQRCYPWWLRPVAYLRSFSLIEFQRATLAAAEGRRLQHLRHAAAALFTYPLEEFTSKFKRLVRAVVGEGCYQMVKRRWYFHATESAES